ncbi:hypothetical protein [Ruminococcus albus]|uniref:Uncharacterized protein n=1 Tax=Ruminococcus albus TaxID=1264 RepID=A0A1H7ITW6_RUMAL|nr:hypothetical protein [Ruminococcus albus]SEK65921.1 hypothetical protein SAMN05216469_10499 [Ruminococcus albus]
MTKKSYGRLILGGHDFQVKDCGMTKFYIFDNDEDIDEERDIITKTVSMEVSFEKGSFDNEEITPRLNINEFPTGKTTLSEMIGMEFEVSSIKEAFEREDTLYVFEHEPLVNYKWSIIGVEDNLVHVKISGTAITDGYSKPPKTAVFEGEFWLAH